MTYPWLQDVVDAFTERLQSGRLAHALLLSGPAESGKVELARGFFAAILCLEGTYPACGVCRSCALARTGAHPDGHVFLAVSGNPQRRRFSEAGRKRDPDRGGRSPDQALGLVRHHGFSF